MKKTYLIIHVTFKLMSVMHSIQFSMKSFRLGFQFFTAFLMKIKLFKLPLNNTKVLVKVFVLQVKRNSVQLNDIRPLIT